MYTTAPLSSDITGRPYLRAVTDVARWSEQHGCGGILISAENRLVDPWLVAAAVAQATAHLSPMVAVQPVHQHPYTVARLVASLGDLYGRRLELNLIAGGFRNELRALGDDTPSDRRYDRLLEFALIVKRLLNGDRVSLEGSFYRVQGLRLAASVDAGLYPGFFVSGASEAGLAVARQLDATVIGDPHPSGTLPATQSTDDVRRAVRLGIIAREDPDLAWSIAFRRFPPDPRHTVEADAADATWRRYPRTSGGAAGDPNPYWFVPFEHYRTFHPYLVGSYDQIVTEVCHYAQAGFRSFILDMPPNEEELAHARVVFERAAAALPG